MARKASLPPILPTMRDGRQGAFEHLESSALAKIN
jgi:hypothetical protein